MDQILEEQEEYAITIGAIVFNHIDYVDDLFLFASSPDKMKNRLVRLSVGLGRLRLELKAPKVQCVCYSR